MRLANEYSQIKYETVYYWIQAKTMHINLAMYIQHLDVSFSIQIYLTLMSKKDTASVHGAIFSTVPRTEAGNIRDLHSYVHGGSCTPTVMHAINELRNG